MQRRASNTNSFCSLHKGNARHKRTGDRKSEEMNTTAGMGLSGRRAHSSSLTDESGLFTSVNRSKHSRLSCESSYSMQAFASGAQHSESNAAYFCWPPLSRIHGSEEERIAYFSGLQKEHLNVVEGSTPSGDQATSLLDLMTIRAFHSKFLRQFSLGTAIGFRTKRGILTDTPAIIVFVARKVHHEWLLDYQRLPPYLEGPGGIWCDVDVVEFSYYGTPAVAAKEQVYTELVEDLRGYDATIGPGSQVASQETYGTLGAIVQSKAGPHQVGFLTNRHVAVDLEYPNQKMFHPLPPNLGPGVYLGAVERATSFITDDLWYGIFASMNPETFVRADGAFIPFGDCFDKSKITTVVKGVGTMGEVMNVDLQAPIGDIVGRQVVKVGRSSGLTKGSIMAYALECNDEKGICFFTDFLIVGENKQAFDLEGDSGSLILLVEDGRRPRPVGIIWGGTANRGRLKLRNGYGPENWTSGVDLGRLLDLLQLSLITSNAGLVAALEEQSRWMAGLVMGSVAEETCLQGTWACPERERGETSQAAEVGKEFQCINLKPPPTDCDAADEVMAKTPNLPYVNAENSAPVLDLLDFGFAQEAPSRPMMDIVMSPKDNETEEFPLALNLFDREQRKSLDS